MEAVDIGPLAVGKAQPYRPHESPANRYINGGSGDAVGILRGLGIAERRQGSSLSPYLITQGFFKAALNAVVADEQHLDYPEDLTGCDEC